MHASACKERLCSIIEFELMGVYRGCMSNKSMFVGFQSIDLIRPSTFLEGFSLDVNGWLLWVYRFPIV